MSATIVIGNFTFIIPKISTIETGFEGLSFIDIFTDTLGTNGASKRYRIVYKDVEQFKDELAEIREKISNFYSKN